MPSRSAVKDTTHVDQRPPSPSPGPRRTSRVGRGELLRQVASTTALKQAFLSLRRRKGSRGADDVTVEDFGRSLSAHLRSIRHKLLTGSYRFRGLKPVAKPKGGEKYRPILIPAVGDRVVQRAIYHAIEPKLRPHLDCPNSHAFRRGRGVPSAVQQLREHIDAGSSVILVVDIENFFGSIDTGALFQELGARLPDASLAELLERLREWEIDDLGALPEKQRLCFPTPGVGIPQGSILSPLLANFYLRDVDREAMDAGIVAIRYADDIAVPCRTLKQADDAFAWLQARLASVGLSIHPPGQHPKSRVVEDLTTGVDYLGFHLRRSESDGTLTIKPGDAQLQRAEALIEQIFDPRKPPSLSERYVDLSHFLSGWLNSFGNVCDVREERQRLLDHTRRCLMTLLVDYKLVRKRDDLTVRQLRLLGVDQIFKQVTEQMLDCDDRRRSRRARSVPPPVS